MSELPRIYRRFQSDYGELWQPYDRTASRSGPLEKKVRQLVKLGKVEVNPAESAVRFHAHRALEAGAIGREIQHTLLFSVRTVGFPATITALSGAQSVIDTHPI